MSGPASGTRARTDDPVVERVNPVVHRDDPVVERADPKIEPKKPAVERNEPKKPAVERKKRTVGRGRNTPAGEPQGPDVALAASQSDLAKLAAIRRARVIKAIALTAIALVLIIFVLQNADPVGVHILWGTVSVRLIWVIVASVLLGALAGYLVGRPAKNVLLHGPSRRQEDPR
jgi:uncharacterized integral membrane protein